MADRSRVLITGISGFTGRHLARRLEASGCEIFGLANSDVENRFPCLTADVGQTAEVTDWLKSVQPTHIVHLAGLSSPVGETLPFYRVHVAGTESLLKAIESAGLNPKKIILAGSANIYGLASQGPFTETQPPCPANHYACSKVAMEWMASWWFDRFPIIITRPFNYTGPGQSEAFVFAKLAAAFRRQDPVLQLGNIHAARDLSGIGFVVEAYCRLLQSEFHSGVVNICSGRSVSIEQALSLLRELTSHNPEVVVDQGLQRGNDIDVLVGDAGRLQSLIGPLEPTDPKDIFRSMIEADKDAV